MPALERQPRLHRQLLRVLLHEITSGEKTAGMLLARETDLADEYGVSRGVVREALRALEDRGLVTVRQGHGAVVEPESKWNVLDSDVLAAVLVGPARVHALRQMLEIRRIIEVEAAGIAAERRAADATASIRTAFERMQATATRSPSQIDVDPFLVADVAFHKAVIDATENRLLMKMAEPLQQSLLEARRPLVHPEDRLAIAVPEHRAVLDAITAGDPASARAAADQILSTVESHLRRYEAESGAQLRPGPVSFPVLGATPRDHSAIDR